MSTSTRATRRAAHPERVYSKCQRRTNRRLDARLKAFRESGNMTNSGRRAPGSRKMRRN